MQRKKLIDYLPPIMQNFSEIKEIMKVEQAEMNLLDVNIQRVLDNAFIEDCDEYGIKKYENILGITASNIETLESRKARVALKWNDMIPYTYKVLVGRLNGLCGINNYTIDADLSNYYFHFYVHLEMFSEVGALEDMLNDMLPANIKYDITNIIMTEQCGIGYFAGAVSISETIEIGGV